MRIEIPPSQIARVRQLLTGSSLYRAALDRVIAKLDAAADGVIEVTAEERQAAASEIAASGFGNAKLCLHFAEDPADVPTHEFAVGTPSRPRRA